ncbi:MAG: FecR family protein [Ferruginibacter sp.]
MDNNNQYDELLVRYLFNEETGEEKVFVENWLDASEGNQRYFNRLKKALQLTELNQDLAYLLDEVNLEEKWNRLEQDITDEQSRIIPINAEETSEVEYEEERPARKSVVYRLLVSVSIAASVLLVIGLGWKFFINNEEKIPVVQNTIKKTDSLQVVVRHELNTSGKEKRIQLTDGSLIVLADKSELIYNEPFTDRRDITLIGKAYFKVAKDKRMPFTVISGDISTTALGTEFTITASKKNNRVIVRLYEGKVVVKAVEKNNKKMKNDIYLLPGQAFVYGSQEMAKVKEFKIKGVIAPEQIIRQELPLDNPSIPENAKGSYFMFNNQSLGEVFEHLAGLYSVNIIYDKNDVKTLYFIGKYNSSDSLEIILRRIAILNGLTVIKKDNAYIISK